MNFDSPHDKTVFNHVSFRLEIELLFRFQVYENCLQDISTVDVSKGHRVVALKSICEQIIYCCDHTALINNIPLKRLFVLYPFSGGFGNLSRKFINYKF